MARADGGPLVANIRGAVGETTFRVQRGRQLIQARSSPGGTPSPDQTLWRDRFVQMISAWSIFNDDPGNFQDSIREAALGAGESVLQSWSKAILKSFTAPIAQRESAYHYTDWAFRLRAPGYVPGVLRDRDPLLSVETSVIGRSINVTASFTEDTLDRGVYILTIPQAFITLNPFYVYDPGHDTVISQQVFDEQGATMLVFFFVERVGFRHLGSSSAIIASPPQPSKGSR